MATRSLCPIIISILVLVANTDAYDEIISDLVKHIQRLDAKIVQLELKHGEELEEMRQQINHREKQSDMKMKELFSRVADLEERNKALEDENNMYRDKGVKHSTGERTEENIPEIPDSSSSEIVKNVVKKERSGDNTKVVLDKITHAFTNKATHRRVSLDGLHVAFSAYMDQDINSMGPGQTLIYKQVLLNDGGGYNKYTGTFTAPMGGVYSFSFFVGAKNTYEESAALCVNSEHKINAAAETWHDHQDLQGGNTVNLKLTTGDVVYIKNIGGGHVEGSGNLRLTSFSGFLIYPSESPTTVVGK